MKSSVERAKKAVRTHKKITIIGGLIVIAVVYFVVHSGTSNAQTTYMVGTVSKGTIVSSVSGSGQIEASSQVDLKARASGEITYVGVKAGQSVRKGQTLFSLNAKDAQKAVRDAQTSLETAQLDLEKFQAPPTSLDVQALQSDIASQEKLKTDAEKKVTTAYTSLLNSSVTAVSSIDNDTRTAPVITGTYSKDKEIVIKIDVYGDQVSYFSVSSVPSNSGINGIGKVSTTVPQPIGDSGLYIRFASTQISSAQWIITLPNKTAANYADNLKAYQDALDQQKETIRTADLKIAQDNQSIADLYQPDSFTLRSKQIAVQQAKDALQDAQDKLSDYYVVAPFAGVISSVVANVGDTASGTLATIISPQKIASITLNEVDISKIALGQKVTLTFDAIDDLSLTGEVAEIDSLGTVTQGVVDYTVKIAFDADDARVKPGMSVSAAIITAVKQDVLTVPASAVKTSAGGGSTVAQFTPPLVITANAGQALSSDVPPQVIPVVTGLSDDTSVEIVSGLAEGDQIVTRTITTSTTTKAATTSAPSLLGGTSVRGAGISGNRNFSGGGR